MIREVKVHTLDCVPGYEGEYETVCNIDFMLEEPQAFEILGVWHLIDRIKLYDTYGDELIFSLCDCKSKCHSNLTIPANVAVECIRKLKEMEENKQLAYEISSELAEAILYNYGEQPNVKCSNCKESIETGNCECMKLFRTEEEEEDE